MALWKKQWQWILCVAIVATIVSCVSSSPTTEQENPARTEGQGLRERSFPQPSFIDSQEKGAVALNEGADVLAAQLAKDFEAKHGERVALLPLLNLEQLETGLGAYLAEALTTRLHRQGITVVERRLIDEVMQEQMFGASMLVDPSSAALLGRLLGAEAVCVGTVANLGRSIEVNLRLVWVEEAQVAGTAWVLINRSSVSSELLDPLPGSRRPMMRQGEDPPRASSEEDADTRQQPPERVSAPDPRHPGYGKLINDTPRWTLRCFVNGQPAGEAEPGQFVPAVLALREPAQLRVEAFQAGMLVGVYTGTFTPNGRGQWSLALGTAAFRDP